MHFNLGLCLSIVCETRGKKVHISIKGKDILVLMRLSVTFKSVSGLKCLKLVSSIVLKN